jgi:hypothetical protein
VRPAACALLAAALLAGGCGHPERKLTDSERRACAAFAARAGAPESKAYGGVFDECVHNTLHPERGGG